MVLWELVFMLVVLKIPLVYLCLVVWWAVRGEPREEHPVASVTVSDTPDPHHGWSRSPHSRRGRPGHGGRPARVAHRARRPVQPGARR